MAPPYSFSNLSKIYRLYAAPRDRFFEALTGRPRHAEVRALDVSGGIAKGSVLGVIGENGSGKSTLFKILAGTTAATAGTVNLSGRVASILELGTAFHPDDTGRRNVILQAALAGLSREEVADALPEIEAFAELGDFFDRPVKTYSSGMQMRLAFSVATAVLPDVILL
ncbi:MAG TPA: ATP-binding cassette domain-containing protein, partial [Thermoanaerobaculia bacterium]